MFLTSDFIRKLELPPILRNTDNKSLCRKLPEQGSDGCLNPVSLANMRLDLTPWPGRMQGEEGSHCGSPGACLCAMVALGITTQTVSQRKIQ